MALPGSTTNVVSVDAVTGQPGVYTVTALSPGEATYVYTVSDGQLESNPGELRFVVRTSGPVDLPDDPGGGPVVM